MAKEAVNRPKQSAHGSAIGRTNGNGAKRRKPRARRSMSVRAKPITGPPEQSKNGAQAGLTQLRFQLASVLRVADNLVNRAVGAYDRLFALEQSEAEDIYLQMGKELAREDKLDEALEALRKVLAAKPNHGEALFECAVIHLRRGAPHAAADLLQRAKSAGHRSQRLHMQLARVLGTLSRHEEALREIESVIEISPELADAHYQRAVILDRLGRYQEAVEAFEAAIRLSPTQVRFHQALGFTLETLGRRADAIQCFKRALEMERNTDHVSDVSES